MEALEDCACVPNMREIGATFLSTGGADLSRNMAHNMGQKHSATAFILAAMGGFIIGYMTSKMLDWINPYPGSGKVPTRHIHDHHHFHHQGSPRHEAALAKFIS